MVHNSVNNIWQKQRKRVSSIYNITVHRLMKRGYFLMDSKNRTSNAFRVSDIWSIEVVESKD